jgi:N-methylhydantoinase B
MTSFDPATLAVLQNAMRQIVDEMDMALEQAAFNPVVSEGRDRANGIFNRKTGEVIAQGDTGLPIFVGVMQYAVQSALEDFPDLGPGDVVMLNDPYRGGTHLMDVKLVRPMFYQGKLFAFLANCAHWTDIGGNVPGGFGVRATDIVQEGVRIPPVLLFRKGVMQEDLLTLLLANMRVPEERRGDLQAQIAALNVGEERLKLLLDKYGAEEVDRYLNELHSRAERQMRSEIASIPDGTYRFETCLDSDGIDLKPIKIAAALIVHGDNITVDFTGSSAPVTGPLNGTLSATFAAVFVALKHTFPDVPTNAGAFAPVKVIVPEDTFLNGKYPRAVSGSAAEVSLRVVDAIFGCLSQAVPGRVPAASFGSVANFTLSGFDPERNRPYIMFRFSGGGYGGHPLCDGLTNGNTPISVARTSPLEIVEQMYPIIFDYYRIREGSAGAGRRRGGFGAEWQLRLRRGSAVASVLGDRGRFPPYGLEGGGDAQMTVIEFGLGAEKYRPQHVTKDEGIALKPDDTAFVAMPGGGGFGAPFERDPRLVLRDVRLGYLSAEDASRFYGVKIVAREGHPTLDEKATAALRGKRGVKPKAPEAIGS